MAGPENVSPSDMNSPENRFGLLSGLLFGILLPLLIASWFRSSKQIKMRGTPAKVPGHVGQTWRNYRFLSPVETPWEGATTLACLFEQACSKYSSKPLLGTRKLISTEMEPGPGGKTFEKVTLGSYIWISYGDAFDRAVKFASGLAAIGHQKGERLAIFSETRAEWIIALQGSFRRNLTVVTIYASLGEEALAFSLNETEISTVICDHKQLKKLAELSGDLMTVKRVVYMEDGIGGSDVEAGCSNKWKLFSFSDVESLGKENPIEPDLPARDDIAVIMYTSGSTGMPKGVMISHGNLVSTVAGVVNVVPDISPEDAYLAYLPLAHIFELAAEITMVAGGASIGYGSTLTLTDTSGKIKKGTRGDASELRPTLMTAVPAILDRIRDGVRKMIDQKGGAAKKLFNCAYSRRLSAIEGSWLGAWGPEKIFWDALVFSKVKKLLGGRVRGLLCGGAPLSPDTQRFINICLGVPIGQGYGLTETCAGATFSEWDDNSVGRVGPPLPNCYIKLIDWETGGYLITDKPMPRGEVVIGGPGVTMGYFKNEAKTNEVYEVDERGMRWFHTGDIGQFHVDGCLEIIDRRKDIVKLQHGEYVSLGKVEAALAASSYVDNIMVHADPSYSYCVALIVPNQATLEKWAETAGVKHDNFADLCHKKESVTEILKSLSKVGNECKLQKFEVPAKIKLLPEPWTPEAGLVTAAMKLKRENIRKTFADDLRQLYE